MRIGTALLLLACAAPAFAQDEQDAAHREDRLRTQALNARSANGYAPGDRPGDGAHGRDGYDEARAEYQRRLAAWRRRVAACEAGYYEACQQ